MRWNALCNGRMGYYGLLLEEDKQISNLVQRELQVRNEFLDHDSHDKLSLWTKNPWKSCELIHSKFTWFSKDFNGIFMRNVIRFFVACHPGKSMKKNIKKVIKKRLIFQFSWAMKTLKFWANPWNTHENTMKILGCFSWPFNGIENAMYYKEGFSWCCSSWSFHEATEFMAHEKPMVFPLMLKD